MEPNLYSMYAQMRKSSVFMKILFLGVEIDVIPQTNPRSSFELIISDETMFFFSTYFGRGGIIHNRIKRCML